MICIVSNEYDKSTDDVIQWLNYHKADWARLNGEDFTNLDKDHSPSTIDIQNSFFSSMNIKSVWFRRFYPVDYFINLKVDDIIKEHCWSELSTLHDFLYYSQDVKILGENDTKTNKLINLRIAASCGLSTPKTIITGSKVDLQNFYNKVGKIIIKSISESIDYTNNGHEYTMYTKEIDKNDIMGLSDFFFPLLAQEKLTKKFELRIFFLDHDFFPMAIFSQENSKTEIDFRKYDHINPNRNVPFTLPNKLKHQLVKLIDRLNLNTGSIDIVCTQENDFVFLEVNPSGQFGMVSYPCNYYLEKKIAKKLIKYAKENEDTVY